MGELDGKESSHLKGSFVFAFLIAFIVSSTFSACDVMLMLFSVSFVVKVVFMFN